MKLVKIKSIKHIGKQKALNISMKKNKNFMLGNGILTHNTKVSQDALRNVMETYASNVFFILTANNINKIIEPLKSRCVPIPFAYPDKLEVGKFLINICEKESMKYTVEGISQLVEMNYPSIRNCVIALQDLFTEEKDVIVENVKPVNEIYENMWSFLQTRDWHAIKTQVMQSTIDPRELNTFFWQKALDTTNIKLLQLTCRNEKDIASGSDPKIIFVTSLIEMCK